MRKSGWNPALLALCGALVLGPVLSGCEEEGTAEQIGEKIDETVERAGDAVKDAADELEKKTD